jgi:hypothetical protein
MSKRKPSSQSAAEQAQAGTDTDGVSRWVDRKPFGSSATDPPVLESAETLPRKAKRGQRRGRLDRAVLAMLGKGLEDCFDEIRKQEVPERFKSLLRQF